jgi:hypothetical protein
MLEKVSGCMDKKAKSHRIDEVLSINIFKSNIHDQGQSSTELNGQLIYSHLLIDCLIRMESSLNDKNELIALCKQQYKNTTSELNLIEEFDNFEYKILTYYLFFYLLFGILDVN